MRSSILPFALLAAALLPAAPAGAVGLGDIVLHSRVGEPLRAEVPVLTEPGEDASGLCFSLAPLNGSDLPVIASAKTRLVRENNRYVLQINGTKPVAEPVFLIGLRTGCGAVLQRDYVLMPAEPVVFAAPRPSASDAAVAAAPVSTPRRGAPATQEWRASEGETLESIAETLIPDDLAQQRRMLAALKRANPKMAGKATIADGATVIVPDLRQRVVAERELLPEQKAEATRDIARPPSPAEPPRKTVRAAPKPKAPAGPDRIMLGAPPADIAAGTTPPPPKGSRAELDERMQKLEATIQSLNTQIEALDKALALTAESIALQQKLQAAQKSVVEPGSVPAPVAAPAVPPPAAGSNWLEVITAAFVGGLLAAGLALLLGRRRNDAVAREMPLAVTTNPTHRPTMAVTPAVPAPSGPRGTADRETLAGPADIETSEMGMEGDESVLALAEIMLSFGRPEAAAQTLSQYIEEHAPENPKPWLMLLDLYRRGRMRSEYARLAPLLKQRFNLYVAQWEEIGNPVSGLKSIEDYAHVTRRVTATWGTQDCLDYLRGLVNDTREGQRGGFPLEVIEEIVLLLHTLESGYNLQAVRRTPSGVVADAA